jgi:hypothetical protein
MEDRIAFCGINCSGCPAFVATQKDDDKEKAKVAARWSTPKYPFAADDVHCDGCLIPDGRLMSFCGDCDVRQCALDRRVGSCAHCDEYPCDRLDKVHAQDPAARAALDEIAKNA